MVWWILVSTAAVTTAKPLPTGMKIFEKGNKLLVSRSGVTVALFDPDSNDNAQVYEALKGAELSDDGKHLLVKATGCLSSGSDAAIEVPLAAVEARIENALGMQVHFKKKYEDAIAHFSLAVQADSGTPVYATNLLSAQSMANKLDDADKTLAAYGPKNLPWFGWRLAVDPELKNVRERASAKALGPAKTSKQTYANLKGAIAVNPQGFVAVSERVAASMGFGQQDLVIYDPKTSAELLRLRAVDAADDCIDGKDSLFPCTKQGRANTARHQAALDVALGALGFEKQATSWSDHIDGDKVTSPDHTTVVELTGKDPTWQVTVRRGKRPTAIDTNDPSRPKRIGFAGKYVVLGYVEPYACGGADSQQGVSRIVVGLDLAAMSQVKAFFCFHEDSQGNPDAVTTSCWPSKAACDKTAAQDRASAAPACTAAASVFCYTSSYDSGERVTSCTSASKDCDTLRTTESVHNRRDPGPTLSACTEQP